MDSELLKTFASLGGTGLLALAMWHIARQFMTANQEQVKLTYEVQNQRISALEVATLACEKDRREIHEQLIKALAKHPCLYLR